MDISSFHQEDPEPLASAYENTALQPRFCAICDSNKIKGMSKARLKRQYITNALN
jgi:hypothetical protein